MRFGCCRTERGAAWGKFAGNARTRSGEKLQTTVKTDPTTRLPTGAEPPPSLTRLLDQNEHVKELVEEAASELSSVNTALKQELAEGNPSPAVEATLEKSEVVEEKVQDASEKLAEVNRALEGEVRDRRMVDHQLAAAREREKATRHSAFHDPLTGLANRALFNDRLEHGLMQAGRHDRTLAVMFIDLDGFKAINDTHGHEAGDSVLTTIADRLKATTRGDDTVSRHGGDEFLYMLAEVSAEHNNIAKIAEKLVLAIQEPCSISTRDLNIAVSVKGSIGISIFPKDGISAKALVEAADRAMYRAKQARAGYSFAETRPEAPNSSGSTQAGK